MKIIIFTPEYRVPNEAQIIALLLENGVNRIHIRKPFIDEVSLLLKEIPEVFHPKISIHKHLELLKQYSKIGFHISKKYKHLVTKDWKVYLNENNITLSTGIHQWEEISFDFDYLFISPVFDSISKKGYLNNPDLKKIPIKFSNYPIYALGGIRDENILETKRIGYKGVGLLGSIWGSNDPLKTFLQLKRKTECHD